MTEGVERNERLARMLGWEREPRHTYSGKERVSTRLQWHRGRYWTGLTPDYTTWARFPELQEYAQGLMRDLPKYTDLHGAVVRQTGALTWLRITPEILGDAILSVCGDVQGAEGE